jgi:hypothetical protein
MTVALSSAAGDGGINESALDPVRDRLAGIGREYTPVDVAAAMRAEGLAVSDSAVLDTVGIVAAAQRGCRATRAVAS